LSYAAGFLAAQSAFAQPLPDYPPFQFTGQIGGNPNISTFHSDAVGTLIAKATGFGSFHTMTLTSDWNPARLGFKYPCVYARGAQSTLATSPTYSDGQECPPGGPAASNFVRAIKITLTGSEQNNYALEAQCTVGYFGQHRVDVLPTVSSGQFCGHETGGAPLEWINQIEIRLHRN
jgi:hypothetical protein